MEYIIPAIRGVFGSWIFYCGMMSMKKICDVVKKLDIDKNKKLSQLRQRAINTRRIRDIVKYLLTHDDRFFNSLVLTVSDASPEWYPALITSENKNIVRLIDSSELQGTVGYLLFSGKEHIMPIDGQHRIEGIKEAIKQNIPNEYVPVIFVSTDRSDEVVLEKTRRLFTALNKNAQKVSKKDIIALDEDDLMAIVCRRLVEDHPWFSNDRIKIVAGSKISDNDISLTTIENLYDVLTTLFTKIAPEFLKNEYKDGSSRDFIKQLKNGKRLDDISIELAYEYAIRYFEMISTHYKKLDTFFNSANFGDIAKEERRTNGTIIFRPVGLNLITKTMAELNGPLEQRFDFIKQLPMKMHEQPYCSLLVDQYGKINEKNETGVRNIFLHAIKGSHNSAKKNSVVSAWKQLTKSEHITLHDVPKDIPSLLSRLHKLC